MGKEYSSKHVSDLEHPHESIVEFRKMNKKITNLASGAKNVVITSGRGSEWAESAVEDVLSQFEVIAEQFDAMSYVNASTLLHRSAQLAECSAAGDSLDQRFPKLLEHLVDGIYQSHNLFDPRHTASAIWSFGVLGRQMLFVNGSVASFPACFSALLEKAEAQAELFEAREITSILSGVGNLELKMPVCGSLIVALLGTMESKLETFGAQELSTCIRALAKIEYRFDIKRGLLPQIVIKFKEQITADIVQDRQLANFMWGVANLGYEDSNLGFCEVVSAHLVKRLPFARSQPLSTVIWALGILRYLPSEDHLETMATILGKRMDDFEPIHVAKVLHAFAGFGFPFDCLITSSKSYLASNISQFGRQELCNVLWSLAILDGLDRVTFQQSIDAIKKHPRLSIHKMNSSELRQLYTCSIHIRSFCPGSEGEVLPPDWAALCEKEYANGQREKKTYSVALSVMLTLQKIGSVCQNHSLHVESSKVLDLVTTVEGVRVAIEVTIPTHYFVNSAHQLKGPRLWAMKVMEAQGLVVLRVDCRQWNKLRPGARAAYIRQQLGMSQT